MPTVTIYYEAKCKHCKFFKYGRLTKEDGTPSKKMRASCNNINSERCNQLLTLKSTACDKLEL